MLRIPTIVFSLLFIGTTLAKESFPQIKKLFGAKGQADAEAIIKFYEKEIPGYMKLVEKDLADMSERLGDEPEELRELTSGINEELAEFHGEYREMRLEAPEEARNMLETKRAEVQVQILSSEVRTARKTKSAKVMSLETKLKVELGRLFDKRLDQLRSELDGLAEEEREDGLDAEGKKEKAYIERMLKLKNKHRKLILEVAFLRAVEGEELFEL